MNEIERFQLLMAEWGNEVILPHVERIKNKEPTVFSHREVFNTIFMGSTEITETFEALQFSETLLSVASPRSKKVAKEKYIKYVINTYLQDVYILKERLNTYATKIKRMHERAGRRDLVSKHIDPLFPLIKSSFQGIVDVRGAHVHSARYTDEQVTEATSMALIAAYNEDYTNHFEYSVMKLCNDWRIRISKNNIETEKLLKKYFSNIQSVIEVNGSVFVP
ncbi:hypothetical protein D8S93_24230 [Vibrio sp. VGrn 2]|uniref:hypothetical protein n=1 Tax=Vibrio sp. VGrn 2 TaxID=2419839 RepID=UPI00128E1FED|nr:hypothetical protein [Vibrio sp. VGrn 2]MPS41675.1 hypothetical protein [Vibrio sp. VGrn 2]